MIKWLLPQSEFSKNVLTLMTGTTIAQAIPVAITPILTRIYTPEDFGVLALFVSITAVLGAIANGRYELAIMLPEHDDDAINVAALGLLISIAFSFILLLPAFFFNESLRTLLGNQSIGFWLYFVPFVVLLMGFYNVLNYLNTRKKLYRDLATANVYKATAMASVQLGVGFFRSGAAGLVSGHIISQIAANYRLARNTAEKYDFKRLNWTKMKRLAVRYLDFPKFSMWAVLANTLAYNLTNILISLYFNITTLGFYSLAQKILNMPASLIGKSIGQVYFQEATREKNQTGKAIKTFNRTSKKLFILSVLMFLPIYYFLPIIFKVVFGEDWVIAGKYGQLILPFVMVQFISSALSNTNNIFEKQKLALAWQVGLFVLSVSILYYSSLKLYNFESFLILYSSIISLYYAFLYVILRSVARGAL
ncbi:oligosaccharide flippase family protein [uncultured Desulfuromusa sp.]|uniref:lipopolysaccharide biosynthesis protein n=1 Tax=uncultured Desulfuromusa sp. TaxID=219183 RepID=UPI002AA7A552|nr:oligosaccharide flippase family protein [uncultured Desulfuromusa sp.]